MMLVLVDKTFKSWHFFFISVGERLVRDRTQWKIPQDDLHIIAWICRCNAHLGNERLDGAAETGTNRWQKKKEIIDRKCHKKEAASRKRNCIFICIAVCITPKKKFATALNQRREALYLDQGLFLYVYTSNEKILKNEFARHTKRW